MLLRLGGYVKLAGPPIDFLGSIFWQFTTFIVVIVAIIGFLVYRYYLEPPISRAFTSAKWKKGPVGFVQDDANVVHLVTSQAALPEGVISTKRGLFLQSRAPYIQDTGEGEGGKGERKPGRPPKVVKPDNSREAEHEAFNTVLQAPILEGFGKAVFFGYDGAPLVANLKTLAFTTGNAVTVEEKKLKLEEGKVLVVKRVERFVGHADLRILKEIIPATISRTQLSALARYSEMKGYLKRGGEQMKLLFIALAVIAPIAVTGIVAYLLLNGGK
jgi:hypothetical protein